MTLTASAALLLSTRAEAASSTLTILAGSAEVSSGESGFTTAVDGSLVAPGTTIRTGPGSHVVVTLIDGSTITIEPDSELTLEQQSWTAAGDVVVNIVQSVGRSWHVIGRSLPAGSEYNVKTPTATAAVRGTAFEVVVEPDGSSEVITTDGLVATTAAGETVEVAPGQFTSVRAGTPPGVPQEAEAPESIVRIVVDPTSTAVAVDAAGRSVGVSDGQAIRYVPGSRVEFVDGKIVIIVPQNEPGRISTVVRSDDPERPVTIQTQVESRGAVVANTVEVRKPDRAGFARGGIVTFTGGVLVLPDEQANAFTIPNIGGTPSPDAAVPLFRRGPQTPEPLIVIGDAEAAERGQRPFEVPPGFAREQIGDFKGGFQQFGFFGLAQDAEPEGLELPPGFTQARHAAGGVIPVRGQNLSTFSEDLPEELRQFIPAAPQGGEGKRVRGFELPEGFTFGTAVARERSGQDLPVDPSLIQELVRAERAPRGAFPLSEVLGEGTLLFGRAAEAVAGEEGRRGECELTPFGITCASSASEGRAGRAASLAPCDVDQRPTRDDPCIPLIGAGRGGDAAPVLRLCDEGERPGRSNLCQPRAERPAPECAAPLVRTGSGECGDPAAETADVLSECRSPRVLVDGRCSNPNAGGRPAIVRPTRPVEPPATAAECTLPQVRLPNSECGDPPPGQAGDEARCRPPDPDEDCPEGAPGQSGNQGNSGRDGEERGNRPDEPPGRSGERGGGNQGGGGNSAGGNSTGGGGGKKP